MVGHKTQLEFMMITASPDIAKYIEKNGVSRIFIDQEVLGKQERQGHLNTHKAAHTACDIQAVAKALSKAELMVRVNPLNPNSQVETDTAIDCGANRLMLPMFTTTAEVERFLTIVKRRVPVSFLLETPQALVRLEEWLPLLRPGYDEVHIGLNDLTIGMGLKFLFEPIAGRLLDVPSQILRKSGIAWGFGGVAQIGKGDLSAELVLGEHARLGSERVILSRAFHLGTTDVEELDKKLKFADEIARIRKFEREWRSATPEQLAENLRRLGTIAFALGKG